MASRINSLQVEGDFYGQARHSTEGKRTQRKSDWVQGWWEHICPEPIYVNDKYELKKICQAESRRTGRTIIPKAFMKWRSDGKGIAWNF